MLQFKELSDSYLMSQQEQPFPNVAEFGSSFRKINALLQPFAQFVYNSV